jgi:hypothetical protein
MELIMGRFEGVPVVTLLDDGRRVKLSENFSFIDDSEARWNVPEGAIVDGASIPRFLWSFIGGPFEGKYRNASIIHDWFCDLRSRPWLKVHRMFYDAMIASGVDAVLAKTMYAGVYVGGPRWSETVVANVSHMAEEYLKGSRDKLDKRLHYPMPVDEFGIPIRQGPYANDGSHTKITVYHYNINIDQFKHITDIIHEDTSLKDIESFIDNATQRMPPNVVKEVVR